MLGVDDAEQSLHNVESVSDLKTMAMAQEPPARTRVHSHSGPESLLPRKSSAKMREDPSMRKSKSGLRVTATARAIRKHFLRQFEREKHMMLSHYHVVFFGSVFQYVHSVSTNLAYIIHEQREVLYDLGFATVPALSLQIISEILFFMLLFSTIFFAISPFFSFVNTNPHSARPRANSRAPPPHPEQFYHLYRPNSLSNNASPMVRPMPTPGHGHGHGDLLALAQHSSSSSRWTPSGSRERLLLLAGSDSPGGHSPLPREGSSGRLTRRSPIHTPERRGSGQHSAIDYLALPTASEGKSKAGHGSHTPSHGSSGYTSPSSPQNGMNVTVIGGGGGSSHNNLPGNKPNDVVIRPFYTTLMLSRFLSVLVICQSLRITSFLVTSLPGPNYHCRPGSEHYDPPHTVGDIFLRQDALYGCGDLVFSSHTIFITLCCLTYFKYGRNLFLKKALVVLLVVFALLVVAARKHYSLDVVVALYTVPLVWTMYDRYYPDLVQRSILLMEFNQYRARMLSAQVEEDTYDVIMEGTSEGPRRSVVHEGSPAGEEESMESRGGDSPLDAHTQDANDSLAPMSPRRIRRFKSVEDLESQVQGFAEQLNFEVDEEALQLAVERFGRQRQDRTDQKS
jgi:hypothetical protein